MRGFVFSLWEIMEVILITAVTVFLIRAFIVQPFLVSGSSMFSSFVDGDYVLVDQLTYRFYEPQRGDVIVFRYPLNPSQFYIKRIIGLPGDHVVVRNGKYLVNDIEIKEDYLDEDIITTGRADAVVGEKEIFASGDNRPHSYDSRNFGPFSFDNLIGVVKLRLLPFLRAGEIKRPVYDNLL